METGFSVVGICDLTNLGPSKRIFDEWLSRGFHGDMHYLSRSKSARYEPGKWLKEAKSVICVGLNYYNNMPVVNDRVGGENAEEDKSSVEDNSFQDLIKGSRSVNGIFSRYAISRDYHLIVKDLLANLERKLRLEFKGMRSSACVDTKPVPERTLALLSGIGWLGKNTCIISSAYGSWMFLGELITNIEFHSDRKIDCSCGDCSLCIEACPTGALIEPFLMDARLCISYLTIEKRGKIPSDSRRRMGRHVFGCDICQEVCPFNEDARESKFFANEPNPLVKKNLNELANISDEDFNILTPNSTIRTCGAKGLRRNARIALENIRNSRSPWPPRKTM